jgi:Xaa-Pro aminopeptidase
MLGGASRIAMQYSPNCMIPYVSLVDGGTIDLIRGLGKEIVTSATLVQYFEARWSAEQFGLHREAGRIVDNIRRAAFEETGRRIRADGSVQEAAIAEFIRRLFDENELYTEAGPIVAVNANSGNPHYAPTAELTSPIRAGDFLLIDLWARFRRAGAVYYDITWTGYAGAEPPSEIINVFRIVRDARDKAVDFVRAAVAAGRGIRGCDVDDVTRGFIRDHGFGEHFTHRTGHSIGEEVHGNGANIDNLETKDERRIIPRTCFSIEPGIYLPNFGVRSEIDCYVSESSAGPTGEVQTELVRIVC